MRRLHLVELEDLAWFPAAARDGGRDLLDLAFDKIGFYNGVLPRLLALLDATKAGRIVDVCSGGGGGIMTARRAILKSGRSVEINLTDLYPNAAGAARVRALGDSRTSYLMDPVDATQARDLDGLRTMFGALHHFRPDGVRALIEGLVANKVAFGFFDVASPAPIRRMPALVALIPLLVNMLFLFVSAILIAPFVRPFSLRRLALCYCLPLIPMLFAWDGTVSALRAYTPEELLAIARSARGADGYAFDAAIKGQALYLVGVPT
jgi:hypothetical protein